MTSLIQAISRSFSSISNKAPVPYTQNAGVNEWFQAPQRGTATAPMEAYGAVGTLYSIVNRLANDTSAQCWHLYKKSKDNRRRYAYSGMDDRVEITDHAALKLLNKPNQFMTLQELIEITQQHIDLTGEGWWLLTNGSYGNFPIEIWPLRPDRVSVVTDPNEFLTGYIYTTPDGQKVPLEKESVIQMRMPNPMDIYRGIGPVQSILTDLDSAKYAAEWNRNFFRNSANPGGIIEVPEKLSDEDFKQLVTRWQEQHKGVNNAHRVSVIENGKWIPTTISMRDMQFAELRDVSSTVIREAFGMPKFKLGDVTDVNRATADASERMYARSLLKPRLERIKQALNNDLLPLFGVSGDGIEFDYDSPEPEDKEVEDKSFLQKATAAKMLVDAGYDPIGVLEAVQLPPVTHTKPVPVPNPTPPPTNPNLGG